MAALYPQRIQALGKWGRHRAAAASQALGAAVKAVEMTCTVHTARARMNAPCAINKAAELLDVHAGTVRAWISKGAPVFQRGKRGGGGNKTLVIPADLRAWREGGRRPMAVDRCALALGLGGMLADIPSCPATVQAVLAAYLPQAALIAADGIRAAGLGSARDSLAEAAWTAWRACDARYKRECAHALRRAWFRTLDYLSRHHGAPVEGEGEGYRFPDKIQRLNRAC